MLLKVAVAMGEFQAHMLANIGEPIGLKTVAAFARMVQGVLNALQGE